MTRDVVEESADVFVPSQPIDGETNSTSDYGVHSVIVRNAIKTYGSGSQQCAVLQELNMTVKKGSM
jgi:hypothetical protein